MSHTPANRGGNDPAPATPPVLLARYLPGVVGESRRTVHLIPLPAGGGAGAAGVALCGALLHPDAVEMVAPGHGAPCTLCLVNYLNADPKRIETSASIPPSAAYRRPPGRVT
jgi:hypothetical protein